MGRRGWVCGRHIIRIVSWKVIFEMRSGMGRRSVWASSESVAVDLIAPVMRMAAWRWILVSLAVIPLERQIVGWGGVSQTLAA